MRIQAGAGAPADVRLGTDFSGTVVAVGTSVTHYKPGDEVFGGADGAFGEYVVVRESRAVAMKPPAVSHAEAAALPIAASTALQALRDKGHLQPGQTVLINGASGGVGTYAVQIAHLLGGKVAAVCSTRNAYLVRSLGADSVIDYTQTDVTQGSDKYDLIVDTVSSHSLADYRRILNARGALIIVGSLDKGRWLGGMSRAVSAKLHDSKDGQRMGFMLATLNHDDLTWLAGELQAGRLRSVIDRHYTLADTAEALRYLEAGHARGKIVIDVN
jgi:NADPH:quinone reductase-like Zn-dependent oxidoreductase